GELLVDPFDTRFPSTEHDAAPTPLGNGATLTFDRVEVANRGFARFDDHLKIGNFLDDRDTIVKGASATVVLLGEKPSLTVTAPTTRVAVSRGASLDVTYAETSALAIEERRFVIGTSSVAVTTFSSQPQNQKRSAVTIPVDAPLGPITAQFQILDRAGRIASAAIAVDVTENASPVVTSLTSTPASLYANHNVAITVTAHDDVAVKTVHITTQLGSQTPVTVDKPIATTLRDVTVGHTFLVPGTFTGGGTLHITATADDVDPTHASNIASFDVTILHDTTQPTVALLEPPPNTLYVSGGSTTIPVRATVTDDETGVQRVTAQLDDAAPVTMTKSGNEWTALVPVPARSGSAIQPANVVVKAIDFENNLTTATVAVNVKPSGDPNAPALAWACTSPGATYPPGYTAKLRVLARAANEADPVADVKFFVDADTTGVAASTIEGEAYELAYVIPSDKTTIPVRVEATNASGLKSEISTTITITNATPIVSDMALLENDRQFDGGVLLVQSGTLTIAGQHNFTQIIVLDGARIRTQITNVGSVQRLQLNAPKIFVACGGAIDADGNGYNANESGVGRTYPDTFSGGSTRGTGGSHGGAGGKRQYEEENPPTPAATYDSIYDPNQPGGAGSVADNATCDPCNGGGGVIRIQTAALVLDGAVSAGGVVNTNGGGGAGGAIRIDAGDLSGGGSISANGARAYDDWLTNAGGGGGGRIAVYYQHSSLDPTHIVAAGGAGSSGSWSTTAPAGTVYLQQRGADGAKIADQLRLDNLDRVTEDETPLPALAAGSVTSVANATITLSQPVADWIDGSWIEFLDANGAAISSYRIASHTATSVTVALPTGETVANAPAGSTYRQAWLFDDTRALGNARVAASEIRSATYFTNAESRIRIDALHAATTSVTGWLRVDGALDANALTVDHGAKLEANGALHATTMRVLDSSIVTHTAIADGTKNWKLSIDAGTLEVDATSAIDVTGKGYDSSRASDQLGGVSASSAAGSHGGNGGNDGLATDATYDSAFDPQLPGGASYTSAGGGVVRIHADQFVLNGKILANGATDLPYVTVYGGAGGAIRIDANSLTGSGEIHADGGVAPTYGAGGGGGRIAVYATTLGLDRAHVTAHGGLYSDGTYIASNGAAGTLFFKTGSATLGDLVADNGDVPSSQMTGLIGVNYGVVSSFTATTVTDAQAHFATPSLLRGIRLFLNQNRNTTWPITANTATTLTVGSATTPFSAQVGDAMRGLYRFDAVTIHNAILATPDFLESGAPFDRSLLREGNAAPPTVDVAKIVPAPFSTGVMGKAGAVADPDQPIVVRVKNVRTGNVFTGTAAADGAFFVRVEGLQGDALAFSAKDGHRFPLETREVSIGTLVVNTPEITPLSPANWNVHASFRADRISANGSLMAVATRRGQGSDDVVLFDIADPKHPQYLRTFQTENFGFGPEMIEVYKGWVLTGSHVYKASDPSQVLSFAPGAGVRHGNLYFHDGGGYENYSADVDDISDPANPKTVGSIHLGHSRADDIFGFGDRYMVLRLGSLYSVYDWTTKTKLADLDLGTLTNGGEVGPLHFQGTTAYAGFEKPDPNGGATAYTLAVLDFSNPAHPRVATQIPMLAKVEDVAGAGVKGVIADNIAGVARFDSHSPLAPAIEGYVAFDDPATAVALGANVAYVAYGSGIAVIGNIPTPPVISTEAISLKVASGTATIAGAPHAINGGTPPTTVTIRIRGGASITAPVAADGSFSGALSVHPGDALELLATDSLGLVSDVVAIGAVPFGNVATFALTVANGVPENYSARLVATEGSAVVVASSHFSAPNQGGSDVVLVFDASDVAHPILKKSVSLGIDVTSVVIARGVAYIGTQQGLFTLDVHNPAAQASGPFSQEYEAGLYVSGDVLVTAPQHYPRGFLRLYDVSTPMAPRFLTDQASPDSNPVGVSFVPYGDDYLLALRQPGFSYQGSHTLAVLDRRSASLAPIATLDLDYLNAFRAAVVGTKLYLASVQQQGIAVVDLSDPAHPIALDPLAQTDANALVANGSRLFVAAGNSGLRVLDASITPPALLGNQPLGAGFAYDIQPIRGGYVIANETNVVFLGLDAAPTLDLSKVALGALSGGNIAVTGTAGAVSGSAPLTVEVRSVEGAASANATADANGAFNASVAAAPGQRITISVTDSVGRKTGPFDLGRIAITGVNGVAIAPSMADDAFSARLLAADGATLAVSDNASSTGVGSGQVVLFDTSSPSAPAYRDTVDVGFPINALAATNGFVYAGTTAGTAVINLATGDQAYLASPGNITALAVAGPYAFAGYNNQIQVLDVRDPMHPRSFVDGNWLSLGGTIRQILPYRDALVVVTDAPEIQLMARADVGSIYTRTSLEMQEGAGNLRGVVAGDRLFYTDAGRRELVAVDLTNLDAPVELSRTALPMSPTDVRAVGNTLYLACGFDGFLTVDVTNAAAPVVGTRKMVGGFANAALPLPDVALLANGRALQIVAAASAPQIGVDHFRVLRNGANAAVSSDLWAVRASGTFSAEVRNLDAVPPTTAPATISAQGQVSASIAADAGNRIELVVTDGAGRTSRAVVGSLAFGNAVISVQSDAATRYFARSIGLDGSKIVASGPTDGLDVFDAADPTNPLFEQNVSTFSYAYRARAANGTAFAAGYTLSTFPLGVHRPAVSRYDGSLYANDVFLSGNLAFTGGNAYVRSFDVSNPKSIVLKQELQVDGVVALSHYSDDYLLAFGAEHLSIVDRHDPAAMSIVATLDLPGLTPVEGVRVGNRAFLACTEGRIAVIDLTNPLAPVQERVIPTAGAAHALRLAGNSLFIADGQAGVSVLDVTDPAAPVFRGAQKTDGTAWDLELRGSTIYIANDLGVGILTGLPLAPEVRASLVSIGAVSATTAAVAGRAQSVLGRAPLTISLTNAATHASVQANVATDGSFYGRIAAAAGEELTAAATDGAGVASASVSLGNVPPFNAAPAIRASLISISAVNASTALVRGIANAVTGAEPLTVQVANVEGGVSSSTVAVDGNGAFLVAVPAVGGQSLALTATAANGQTASAPIGTVPASAAPQRTEVSGSDGYFLARRFAHDADLLAAAPVDVAQNGRILFFPNGQYESSSYFESAVGVVHDVAVAKPWIFVAGDNGAVAYDITNYSRYSLATGPFDAVGAAGNLAFLATTNGVLKAYSVSREQRTVLATFAGGLPNVVVRSLLPFERDGRDYLAAISGDEGHDVMVFDVTDPSAPVRIADYDVPGFEAARGRLADTRLWLTGRDRRVYGVDLTNPAAPTALESHLVSAGQPRGVSGRATLGVVAADAAGIALVDPAHAAPLGYLPTAEPAYDVVTVGSKIIVAADHSVLVFDGVFSDPPVIDRSRIALGNAGANRVSVFGTTDAVSGAKPIRLRITNSITGVFVDDVNVTIAGGFSTLIAAKAGELLTATATDVAGRVTSNVPIGALSLGTVSSSAQLGDSDFVTDRMKVEGNVVAITIYNPATGLGAVAGLDATNPNFSGQFYGTNFGSVVRDVAIFGNHEYVAAGAIMASTGRCCTGYESAVQLVARSLAGVNDKLYASALNGGAISSWTIGSDPMDLTPDLVAVPSHLNLSFSELLVYQSKLIGITPDKTSGAGHDIVFMDRATGAYLSEIDLPQFDATRARITGHYLVVSGRTGKGAIVDLADLNAAPIVFTGSGPMSSGAALVGSRLALANGAYGISLFRAAPPAAPTFEGLQGVNGESVVDVAFVNGALLALTTHGLSTITGLPPMVDLARVSITNDASGVVARGLERAVTGQPTFRLTLTASGGASATANSSNGAFAMPIAANGGETLTLNVTDAISRTSGAIVLGTVPGGSAPQFSAPQLVAAKISATALSATSTQVVGSAGAVTGGETPNTIAITNTSATPPTGTAGITVAADGSFTATLNAVAGQTLAVKATDHGNRNSSVVNVTAPTFVTAPTISPAKITISALSAIAAEVRGIAGAVSGGETPVTATLTNSATSGFVANIAIAADGSFVATIAASSGQALTLAAADHGSRTSGTLSLGNVPQYYAPPTLNASLIAISSVSATSARVTGAAGAVTGGETPISIDLTNATTSSVGLDAIVVAADGSFTGTLDASAGQLVDLRATDKSGRTSTPLRLTVPTAAPTIDAAKLTLAGDGATLATLTGAAGAVTGSGTLSVEVRNATSSNVAPVTATVQANGSFSASLTAAAGDRITVRASDDATTPQTSDLVVAGNVPFGSLIRSVAIGSGVTDSTFRARTLAADGGSLLVAGYPSASIGDSPNLVQLDLPSGAYRRTINAGSGAINGVAAKNGYALVASGSVTSVNLSSGATSTIAGGTGTATSVAIAGTYAFVGGSGSTGLVRVYDVTTPATPRFLREQALVAGVDFRSLIPMGSDYLVALTPDKVGATGHDVVVIDRRDVNALRVVTDVDLPELNAFRGSVVGNSVYVAGQEGGLAVLTFDFATSLTPTKRLLATAGSAHAVQTAGTLGAIADGATGATFVETATGATRTLLGSQATTGPAWDALFSDGNLYVADEQGVTVIEHVAAPPSIDAARITISVPNPSGNATITGAANAVRGHSPAVVVRNATSGAPDVAATAGSNGSLSATLAARSGEVIVVAATDMAARNATRTVGSVPFAESTATTAAGPTESGDPAFLARRVDTNGSLAAVSGGSRHGTSLGSSGRLLLFALPNASSPATVNVGDGAIDDVALDASHAFVAADSLSTFDVRLATPVVHTVTGQSGHLNALAVSGNYAFAAVAGATGTLRAFDVTDRDAPAFLREQTGVVAGVAFRKLLILDATHLVAITPDKTGGTGHDVVILDRTNVSAIAVAGQIDIPNFDALDAALSGATLYVVGGEGGLAIVDVSAPATPVLKSVIATGGIARGVAIFGTNEVVVANGGGAGLTFIDVSNPALPALLGSQPAPGNAVDVKVVGKTIYAVTDQHLYTVHRP
ncbi:MAG: hypothetical protein JOZ54_08885, partial [Acidobacteria bacterium]|nr:hypothetical protein [Acidobacteriota bacterium]